MQKTNRWMLAARRLTAFATARRGSMSVEVAFVVIVLVLLAAGAVDFGRMVVEQMRLASAARAGTQYAVQDDGSINDLTGITAAVRQDAGDEGGTISVSSRSYCACPGAASSSCTDSCADGGYPPRYVEVSVSRPFDLFFDYPGMDPAPQLDGVSTMRLR